MHLNQLFIFIILAKLYEQNSMRTHMHLKQRFNLLYYKVYVQMFGAKSHAPQTTIRFIMLTLYVQFFMPNHMHLNNYSICYIRNYMYTFDAKLHAP